MLFLAILIVVTVALRKESVDRNRIIAKEYDWDALSLSARRAWIEIPHAAYAGNTLLVALRKESVDRNVLHLSNQIEADRSLSARRAWIEIWGNYIVIKMSDSRSPQGERG